MSQGGSKAGGARDTLLPLMIRTVEQIINNEIDAVVEELREDSAEVTEQTVLGTVVDEVQGKLPVIAPVFYNIVKTAAWSERQEEQNSHKDPTKASSYLSFALSSCSNRPLHSAAHLSSVRSLFHGISVPTRSTAQSHYT